MNPAHTFYASGTLNGERLQTGPHDARAALYRAAELREDGYHSITLTDLETGVEFDIERFMSGNSRAEH